MKKKKRKKREVHTWDNKSPTTSDLEGNSWSGMSSIRIRARQARSTVSDIWRACSARSVNEHASRCLLLGKFSRQMPERFRRLRTRYENNERIYVREERQGEKRRERKKIWRELSKRMVEYLLRSSSPHPFQPFIVARTISNSNTSDFILSNWINSDFPLGLIKWEEI